MHNTLIKHLFVQYTSRKSCETFPPKVKLFLPFPLLLKVVKLYFQFNFTRHFVKIFSKHIVQSTQEYAACKISSFCLDHLKHNHKMTISAYSHETRKINIILKDYKICMDYFRNLE